MDKTRNNIKNQICRKITEHIPYDLDENNISEDLPLLENGLGLDSIATVELFFKFEEVFGIPFPPELFEGMPLTIGKLIDHIMDRSLCEI